MASLQSKVKWFNSKKGFGFISQDSGNDLFLHFSQIDMEGYKTLNENDVVSYEIVEGDKGKQASKVKLVQLATAQPSDAAPSVPGDVDYNG